MAKNVVISRSLNITVKVGSGTAVKIGGVTGFSGLGSGAASVIDATDFDSTAKEKVFGLKDEGQVKLDYNVIKGDPGQAALSTLRDANEAGQIVITTSSKVYTFDAGVLSNEISGSVDALLTGSASLEITGSIVATNVGA